MKMLKNNAESFSAKPIKYLLCVLLFIESASHFCKKQQKGGRPGGLNHRSTRFAAVLCQLLFFARLRAALKQRALRVYPNRGICLKKVNQAVF